MGYTRLPQGAAGVFRVDWEQQLGAVPRGEKGRDRPFFFPTEKFRVQNGVEIQTAEGGGRRERRKSTPATTNSWKYIFDDMWQVIELFQAHEGLLVAELNREVFYECGDEGGAEDRR